MRELKIGAAIGLAVLALIFILQNTEPVGVVFLAWTWTASRAVVLLVVFLVGVLAGWLGRSSRARRHHGRAR